MRESFRPVLKSEQTKKFQSENDEAVKRSSVSGLQTHGGSVTEFTCQERNATLLGSAQI
jgi:hypothetical protein